jgi:hypothetical protein
MTVTDKNFERFIGNLKKQKPVLQHAEQLTDSILDKIGAGQYNRPPKWLIRIRVVSGSVAAVLFGLFFHLKMEATEPHLPSNRLPDLPIWVDKVSVPCANDMKEAIFSHIKHNSLQNKRIQNLKSTFNTYNNENVD